jgi:uncharacterized iron-regulated protein
MRSNNYVIFFLITIILLSGCAAKQAKLPVESPYYILNSLEEDSILHVPTGIIMTKEQFFTYISQSRVVYVGENHDNLDHHQVQLEIIRTLEEKYPGKVAVGMEMFRKPSQSMLDKIVSGDLDEKAFFKEYTKTWGFDYDYYKDILDYIREKRIPLIALNASRKQMMALRHKGTAQEASEETESLPEMDKGDPYHKAMIEAIFGDVSHGKGAFEGFYEMQLLWEETMAETISDYLQSDDGEDKMMIVLVGGGHVEYGYGIPRRLFRRLPEPYSTVVLTAPKISKDEKLARKKGIKLLSVKLPDVPLYLADFVWATDYNRLENKRPKLGVQIKDVDGGVRVVHTGQGSVAEKYGIKTGDIIESFDGEQVKETSDLIYLIRLKEFGQEGIVTIVREEEKEEIKVHFEKPE